MQIYFAPYDDCQAQVLAVLAQAGPTDTVLVAAYAIDYVPMVDRLVALKVAGATVRLTVDSSQMNNALQKAQVGRLQQAGCDVTIGVSAKGAIKHSKYVVVAGKAVAFGSFNWTNSAESQDNELAVDSDAAVVTAFVANWARERADTKPGPTGVRAGLRALVARLAGPTEAR